MEKETYWDWGEHESLSYTDPNEAIRGLLDDIVMEEDFPDTITVTEYAPLTIENTTKRRYSENLIVNLIEELDQEYGSPYGDTTEITDEMKAKAYDFVESILKNYKPWLCWPTGNTITVSTNDWIKEHHPEWLK